MSDKRVVLEQEFDAELRRICDQANREVGYYAARFLQMLQEYGGVETVRRLLPTMSDGFTALYLRGRLHLTFEYVMLQPEWRVLFTDDERRLARQRLQECGMDV